MKQTDTGQPPTTDQQLEKVQNLPKITTTNKNESLWEENDHSMQTEDYALTQTIQLSKRIMGNNKKISIKRMMIEGI